MATLAAMLTEVESAISAVLTGKSYSIGGRSLTREDLRELRAWRRELKQEISADDGDTGRNYVRFGGPV